jgi:hypothetical protein
MIGRLLCRMSFHKWRYDQPWQTIGKPSTQICIRPGCPAKRTGIFYIERF